MMQMRALSKPQSNKILTASLRALSSVTSSSKTNRQRAKRMIRGQNIRKDDVAPMILTEQQIKLIWASFDEEINNSSHRSCSSYKGPSERDLRELLVQFPNLNPSLAESYNTTISTPKDDESQQDTMPRYNRHAMTAEEKLNRMLYKVKTHDLNTDILPRTQELIIEEFETVIDLWVQDVKAITNRSQSKNFDEKEQEQATDLSGAIESGLMASTLLERWEQEHLQGLRDKLEENSQFDEDETYNVPFTLPAPSTFAYQTVIEAWWQIYSHNSATALTQKNLDQIRDHTTSFLEMMMKRLLASNCNDDQQVYRNFELLNETYEKVIMMWTFVRPGVEKKDIHVRLLMKCADRAAELLNEMQTISLDVSARRTSIKDEQAQLLSTITPTITTFNKVLLAYSSIASSHEHLPAVKEAENTLHKMENIKPEVISSSRNDERFDIIRPNVETYKVVMDAWSAFTTSEASRRKKELSKRIKMIS